MTAIDYAFARLIQKARPADAKVASARMHAAAIKARLAKTFQLRGFRNIGSHARETATSTSDLDLLAIFARDEARWGGSLKSSKTFIDAIRKDLAERYRTTDIRRDGQAVVVNFENGSVDVVPGIFWGPGKDNYPIFLIPKGDGNWMESGPESHAKFLERENERSRGKLVRVVRLIKFWRECRTPRVPLSSFHLELLLASEQTCAGVKTYGQCVFDALYLLASRQARGLQDPLQIAGIVDCAGSGAQRELVTRAAEYSREHAWRALQATAREDFKESARQWNIVFGGDFPLPPAWR